MADIPAAMVKELRDKSGAAMMDCKKALVESEGDPEKAMEWLRQKGKATATKKAARAALEGLVVSAIAPDQKSGAIVEFNCETDFVARNEEFVALANELAKAALSGKTKDAEALLSQKHGSGTVKDMITEKVAKTGENMLVRRVDFLGLSGPGVVGSYVHAVGGKIGALLQISSNKELPKEESAALTRELAMHIVSSKPQFVSREEIPADVIENEKRIELGKEDLAKKPKEIQEKIVSGRLDKILAERCFLDQPFIKDPNQTIAQYLAAKGKAMGAELKAEKFVLYILGETAEGTESNGDGHGE